MRDTKSKRKEKHLNNTGGVQHEDHKMPMPMIIQNSRHFCNVA